MALADMVALAGGVVGVVGGVVGMASPVFVVYLQRKHDRQKSVWSRSEDAAHKALATLAEIRKLYEDRYQWKQGHPPEPNTIQGDPGLTLALKDLRQHMYLVDDDELRSRLGFIASALGYSTAIRAFHGDAELVVGISLCEHGGELIGAYLLHREQPQDPDRITAYKWAIAEADRVAEEADQESLRSDG